MKSKISTRILNLLSLIALMISLAGCSGKTSLPPATSTYIAPSGTPPPSPASIITATLPATPTLQGTPTITVEKECIPIEDKMPDDLVLSGVWLRNEGTPYLENLDDDTDYIVPFKGGGLLTEYAISPDGKLMAYIDPYMDPSRNGTEKRILRVIRSSGHAIDMDYWVEDWQWIIGWVDNQNLALFTARKEIIVLNPFIGEWKKIQEPQWLPHKKDEYDYFPHYVYNPTLSLVFIEPNYHSIEVKDFQTGKILWQADYGGDPTWSLDSSTLIVTPGGQGGFISLVARDMQATEFDARKLTTDPIYNIKLSYDGRKLAFDESNFFLFDLKQMKINQLCTNDFQFWNDPIWSPDNRFVVQHIYNSHYEQFDVLIDTQQMHAYKLISGYYNRRIVWLAKP